jgi:antitoxin CptB
MQIKVLSVKSERSVLLKELLYRSTHRGCKETDILLGDFAENFLDKMTLAQLDDYKMIIGQDDALIYEWLTDQTEYPANLNHEILNEIKKFHARKNA